MAIHIYERTKNVQADAQLREMLSKFQGDHERHAGELTQRLQDLGGEPHAATGLAGAMADMGAIINAVRGPEHLIRQVYDGEDKGLHAYEDRIDALDEASKAMVQQIMRDEHDHLQYFAARINSEEQEHN